jgi:hypothetical protein
VPRKRGHRLPDEWKPTERDVAWQREKGISDLLARREFEKFCLYWRSKAKDNTKLDWSLTWHRWLLTAQEREPTPPGQRPFDPLASARPRSRT